MFHVSKLFTCTVLLVLAHYASGQYGNNKGGYRSLKNMPLEMLFFTQEPERASKDSYQVIGMMPAKTNDYKSNGQINGQMYYNNKAQTQQPAQMIRAAVKSRHTIDYIDIPSEPVNIRPQTILVEANNIPLSILFQSKSSELNLQNEHIPSKGTIQETSSEDEPHRLIHKVNKPIIQEVYEIIKPYRKITQEITPVQEEIQTIVSRHVPDSKYVPVNNQFKGKNQMNLVSSQPKQSYGNEEDEIVSKMISAIKMRESGKRNYASNEMLNYQPVKTSRMQIYMNQLNKLNEQNQQSEVSSSEQTTSEQVRTEQVESLPLVEAISKEDIDDDEEDSSSQLIDDIGIGQEQVPQLKEVQSEDSSVLPNKPTPSIMVYESDTQLNKVPGEDKIVSARNFAKQSQHYGESNNDKGNY